MHREKQFIFIGKQGNDGNGNAPKQKELKILLLYIRPENALDESVTEEFEPDPFGRTRDELERLMQEKMVVSAYALDSKGVAAAVSKMAFGNKLGVKLYDNVEADELFAPGFGNIVAEIDAAKMAELEAVMAELGDAVKVIGSVTEEETIKYGDMVITMDDAIATWEAPLEKVFPTRVTDDKTVLDTPIYTGGSVYVCKNKVARPTVFIPVFPGTNCEYDSKRAFEKAGAKVELVLIRNKTENDIKESVDELEKAIRNSQIMMLPGGFSAGDEPDGSAKFITASISFSLKTLSKKSLSL